MIVNWPWTLMAMRNLNHALVAMDPTQAGPDARALTVKWNLLHSVRTVLDFSRSLRF